MLDQRGQLLRAAVGFAGCSLPSHDRALWALRTWLDSWTALVMSSWGCIGKATTPRVFNRYGLRTNAKRDRTRRKGVQGAASIPRRFTCRGCGGCISSREQGRAQGVLTLNSAILDSQRAQIAETCGKEAAPRRVPPERFCRSRGGLCLTA